ncbi:MAG TPA: glycosyltransferase [Chthoniobacterales bacterium]|jgi:glycosyltransferase involved in cell wall biosynthesis|nr:glycosyltransferase [Chthoniobacterales bacterium]
MRLGYLYSRYPVLSQTFCDMEMLELERRGFELVVGSIYPPLTSIRHPHTKQLKASVRYAPPTPIMRLWEEHARREDRWPQELIDTHGRKYGPAVKAPTRARNAAYFAELFRREGVDHFHVHFANRASHTALFLKAISGIPFSVTAHGQDFMADLGNDALLCEICDAAEFVAVETEYSRGLMQARCPNAAQKIHRVYNGMDLTNFLGASGKAETSAPLEILSVGRLVAFKGFEYLIEACHQLRQRSIQFHCEIIGDGPLREKLQQLVAELRLGDRVTLAGALPQDYVLERLRRCDIFALASTTDDNGASDIFPTVILEAMASARPVVSTTIAGIPESVVDKETGLLVPAGETGLLADALETLCRHPDVRTRYGVAGRARVEEHFQVETTVQPLVGLFPSRKAGTPSIKSEARIAYLIDQWPDESLSALEAELSEVTKRTNQVQAFVCEFRGEERLIAEQKRLALELEFLPDAMAIEAEWQANRELVLALEDDRANEKQRVPVDLFLRQARFAVTLRRLFAQKKICHVHATSSRALICGLLLKKILGVSLSASIEPKPALSHEALESALQHAVGGRIADRKLSERIGPPFFFDRPASNGALVRGLRWLKPVSRIDLTRPSSFWQEWVNRLNHWGAGA